MVKFLMHRVELKALKAEKQSQKGLGFLMHRVELKGKALKASSGMCSWIVPNAPCGVESTGF